MEFEDEVGEGLGEADEAGLRLLELLQALAERGDAEGDAAAGGGLLREGLDEGGPLEAVGDVEVDDV